MKGFNSGGALIITGAGGGGGGGGSFLGGFSTMGNTAGNTGVVSDRIVFVGSNNITLSGSKNADSLTVSIIGAAGGITNINVSAGTTSNNLSAITFSNSNGLAFGLNASTITGSYTVPTVTNSSWTVSDNATSGTVARLAFTNLNGVTLSLSTGAGGSHTIVGSHNALTSQSNQAFSAAGGSSAFQTLSFSDNAQASFTNTAGQLAIANVGITMSATGNTTRGSTGAFNASSIIVRGSNIVSVGVGSGSIIVDATQSNQAFSAAGGSSAFQTLSFSDNAVGSWTNNAGQVALTNVRLSMSATGNTTQSSTGTADVSSLIFRGAGVASVGITGGSVVVSVPAGGGGGMSGGVSTDGNTAGSTGTVSNQIVFVGSNNITLSQSTGGASSATITVKGPDLFSAGVSTDGNTAGSTGTVSNRLVLVGSNGITLSQSTGGASSATVTIAGAPHISSYAPAPLIIGTNIGFIESNTSAIAPFVVSHNIAFDFIRLFISASVLGASTTAATTGNTQFSGGMTRSFYFAIYTRGTGASSGSLRTFGTTSFTDQQSINVSAAANSTQFSYSMRYTFPHSTGSVGFTKDYSSSAASLNFHTSHITDMSALKAVDWQFGSSLSPGNYWLAMGLVRSTASQFTADVTRGLVSFNSLLGLTQFNSAIGTLGTGTVSSVVFQPAAGQFSTVVGASGTIVGSVEVSAITSRASHAFPFFEFIRIA